MGKLTLVVALLALLVSCVTLFLILRPEKQEEEPPPDISEDEPVTFRFGDRQLTPLEGMPLNPYDREGFKIGGASCRERVWSRV